MKIKEVMIILGFVLILLGLGFGVGCQYSCKSLCGVCSNEQLGPCFFLFLFVGILFIVSGASLILTWNKSEKIKKP